MNKAILILLAAIGIFFLSCQNTVEIISGILPEERAELQSPVNPEHVEKAENIAHLLAILTGTAVNPLLVTSAVGIFTHFTTPLEERGQLPWFLILCAVLTMFAFLVSIPSMVVNLPPTISEFVELCNKKIGLIIATPIILPMLTTHSRAFADSIYISLAANPEYMHASFFPIEWLAGIPHTVWLITIVPMLFFTFFTIWLLNYVFDFFIFLSPFGWMELGLKAARGVFYAILLALTVFVPQLMIVFYLIVAGFSVLLFRWSIRWVVMGFVFLNDFIFRKKEVSMDEKGVIAFSNSNIGIPSRHIGRLTNENGILHFSYRKFFLFPKTIIVNEAEFVLKKGFFYSKIINNGTVIFLLPPRYRKIEGKVQTHLGINKLESSDLKRRMKWFENKFA